ncbi:hypothetical protein SCHPADRAFT_909689 [Schizopora paradoxa]|uniref:Uncharacterized protein n=1 Tax=Schizopora paradoxa TaxID=27342 RepID=A0A0H2RCL3_9AGAM|nr:hypothetical protein SCHPADRAFT_909689 [Schizopora paradoxa]
MFRFRPHLFLFTFHITFSATAVALLIHASIGSNVQQFSATSSLINYQGNWVFLSSSGMVLTDSFAANATLEFFGSSVEILTNDTGFNSASANLVIDGGEPFTVPPPFSNQVIFNTTFLDSSILHSVVISKSDESSQASDLTLQMILIGDYKPANGTLVSSVTVPVVTVPPTSTLPFPTILTLPSTTSESKHGFANLKLAIAAIIVVVSVLATIAAILVWRRRKSRIRKRTVLISPFGEVHSRCRPIRIASITDLITASDSRKTKGLEASIEHSGGPPLQRMDIPAIHAGEPAPKLYRSRRWLPQLSFLS